jgi:carbamoyl-phosphate synthase large subunit
VSKVIGVPLARLAAKVMVGKRLAELGFTREVKPQNVSVKESVFPFIKFPGVDIILSPEMKSTGEVMGIDDDFGLAFYKSQDAAGQRLPAKGKVFVSVKNEDKPSVLAIAKELAAMGYELVSTKGTQEFLEKAGLAVEPVLKLVEGRPNIGDKIRNREIQLIINTPNGKGPALDEAKIRSLAVSFCIPCITTINGARAAVQGLLSVRKKGISVRSIQEYHARYGYSEVIARRPGGPTKQPQSKKEIASPSPWTPARNDS